MKITTDSSGEIKLLTLGEDTVAALRKTDGVWMIESLMPDKMSLIAERWGMQLHEMVDKLNKGEAVTNESAQTRAKKVLANSPRGGAKPSLTPGVYPEDMDIISIAQISVFIHHWGQHLPAPSIDVTSEMGRSFLVVVLGDDDSNITLTAHSCRHGDPDGPSRKSKLSMITEISKRLSAPLLWVLDAMANEDPSGLFRQEAKLAPDEDAPEIDFGEQDPFATTLSVESMEPLAATTPLIEAQELHAQAFIDRVKDQTSAAIRDASLYAVERLGGTVRGSSLSIEAAKEIMGVAVKASMISQDRLLGLFSRDLAPTTQGRITPTDLFEAPGWIVEGEQPVKLIIPKEEFCEIFKLGVRSGWNGREAHPQAAQRAAERAWGVQVESEKLKQMKSSLKTMDDHDLHKLVIDHLATGEKGTEEWEAAVRELRHRSKPATEAK